MTRIRKEEEWNQNEGEACPTVLNKRGAALVIILGFLVILTVVIFTFTAQTRTDRLAGRAFLSSAQTRHLLHTALARAMEDIDKTANPVYPLFYALGSQGDTNAIMAGTMNFDMEEDYFPIGNSAIANAYFHELGNAEWQTIVDANNNAIGRIGYVIINTSGLLDANTVGGSTNRWAGLSSHEIQLSKELLGELVGSSHEFTTGRDRDWRRFETLRDLKQLNRANAAMDGDIESFSTFSFAPPPAADHRTFMGSNLATLNIEAIRKELQKIETIPDPDFVINQLLDYLDTDSVPTDIDRSTEPVPLVNEVVLECTFSFTSHIIRNEDGEDVVVSVGVTNQCDLGVEVWYPFVGHVNPAPFSLCIDSPPYATGTIPEELFGDLSEWSGFEKIPMATLRKKDPKIHVATIYVPQAGGEAQTADQLMLLFQQINGDIDFPSIYCRNDENNEMVDRVSNLELPLANAATNSLIPAVGKLAGQLFDANSGVTSANIVFTVGRAVIDPRLNWEGSNVNQWVEVGDNGSGETMGDLNRQVIKDFVTTPDRTDMIHIRNADRIDTPYEFTYLLYDDSKPWETFQMLEENDNDDTRFIMEKLSPHPVRSPLSGRVNPYSPHMNIIASVFLDMPIDEFNAPDIKRMGKSEAREAAGLFKQYMQNRRWPDSAADYGAGIAMDQLEELFGDDNPWILESFFRNTYELFNPHDTLFTILIAAQDGRDADGNGTISNGETRTIQKAVVYVWRNPSTRQAARVFYGLSDTLQSSIGSGQTLSDILEAFKP